MNTLSSLARLHRGLAPAAAALLAACAAAPGGAPPNAAGVASSDIDPAAAGAVSGLGIESHDIVAMTDRMMRDMLANPTLAGRQTPPRVVIDSKYFKNEGSQPINRDLITNRLMVQLNRASNGRMRFITRNNLDMVQEERDAKRAGLADSGTTGLTHAVMGADYRLAGTISTQDEQDRHSGMMQRYNQISFEMVDEESGEIVWSGLYEFARAAADDVIYR